MGEKQLPPGVHQELVKQHVSRKYGEYHKWLTKHQQHADALTLMLQEIEIPTVETLMACSLSKFIHFAANDCEYKGTRYWLIMNWVHPFFEGQVRGQQGGETKLETSYEWTI